jgi:UDP-N-acetylmuramoyl-tripeptide--D-alanyl-D-alanine ligase
MRTLLEKILAFFARKIVNKYKPKIIGITGSVGKTSTRAAVFAVVSQKYRAYTPPKNLNDKLGLPLAIIGADSAGRSLIGWIKIIFRAALLSLVRHKYPEVLVLEYGIDRVGEMDELLAIARPHIAVLTTIGFSHYEYFRDIETVAHEKGRIIEVLTGSDVAVLNNDDERVVAQQGRTKAKVVTYGQQGIVRVENSIESFSEKVGTELAIATPTRKFNASIPAVGTPHVSSSLAACAVAEVLGVEVDLVEKGLARYRPVPGRLAVIAGLRRSLILDDTYNAAPDSVREALNVLARMPGQHKLAVLGDMLELGVKSDEAHDLVGQQVATMELQHVVTVGPGGKIIAAAAKGAGFPEERVISFDTSEEAKTTVRELMQEGSSVLVKGSQGMRMEKIVKEIMAEPMRAGELLCRQDARWLSK